MIISEKELLYLVNEFVIGLLKKAKVNHAGNCLLMSELVGSYLALFNINTKIINFKVKQGRKAVNHYCLQMIESDKILDPTASQFVDKEGKNMPRVYLGIVPDFYKID